MSCLYSAERPSVGLRLLSRVSKANEYPIIETHAGPAAAACWTGSEMVPLTWLGSMVTL
jgi:hypothetical protein